VFELDYLIDCCVVMSVELEGCNKEEVGGEGGGEGERGRGEGRRGRGGRGMRREGEDRGGNTSV